MKYVLFGDVHSNADALRAVFEAVEKEQAEHYIFLGDLVGYGAEPRQCIKLFQEFTRSRPCLSVAGNHDYAVCGRADYSNFTDYARQAVEWTKQQIDEPEMNFLARMEKRLEVEGNTVTHACPDEASPWGYILDIDDARANFSFFCGQVCFIGHTHKPMIFREQRLYDAFAGPSVELLEDARYIINAGSVGQPRDGNPQACYAVWDTRQKRVEFRRVLYDLRRAQEKILAAGLPPFLALRLELGR